MCISPACGAGTKKSHLAVAFLLGQRITAWLARKLQRLREQQRRELLRVQKRQLREQQLREREQQEQQLLLFYRKQPGQQQR